MTMHSHYVGPMQADVNDQASTAKVELRAEPSEAYPDRLGLSVNSYISGKEFVLAHLTAEQVGKLREALDAWTHEMED